MDFHPQRHQSKNCTTELQFCEAKANLVYIWIRQSLGGRGPPRNGQHDTQGFIKQKQLVQNRKLSVSQYSSDSQQPVKEHRVQHQKEKSNFYTCGWKRVKHFFPHIQTLLLQDHKVKTPGKFVLEAVVCQTIGSAVLLEPYTVMNVISILHHLR